jgi:FMN phosphatase YigB (HAD superfamily)
VLFVGDNPGRDMAGAKRMGMKTCLAAYGLRKEWGRGKIRPDYEIRRFGEIEKIVNIH